MILPSTLKNRPEWVFVGPMGPSLPQTLSHLPRLGVDGGAGFTEEMDVWVGDADSYTQKVNSKHIYKLPREKDQSDLAVALSLFENPLYYKFHLWGFLGGRRDHELFNLGETLAFLEKHQECQILFYGQAGSVAYHLVGSGHWKFTHSGIFSLGTLKKTSVGLSGNLQYPVKNGEVLYPLSSKGLSNVASGEITLKTDGPVFLYFPEDQT